MIKHIFMKVCSSGFRSRSHLFPNLEPEPLKLIWLWLDSQFRPRREDMLRRLKGFLIPFKVVLKLNYAFLMTPFKYRKWMYIKSSTYLICQQMDCGICSSRRDTHYTYRAKFKKPSRTKTLFKKWVIGALSCCKNSILNINLISIDFDKF